MASPEMQLVSRIITTGCLAEVLSWGITIEDFKDPIARSYFETIYGYHKSAAGSGSVLGVNTFATMVPGWNACDDQQVTTPALCNLTRRSRLVIEAKSLAEDLVDGVETNPIMSIQSMMAKLQSLVSLGDNKNQDVFFGDAIKDIYNDCINAENGIPTSNLLWPWDLLNKESGGLQGDDYIILYGRPKSKKSFVLAYIVAYLYMSGARGLIYTKEMTPKSILRRIAAFCVDLPYGAMRKGALTASEKSALLYLSEQAEKLSNNDRLICLSGKDAPNGGRGDTPSWLRSKIEQYKPQYVAVDSLYLMNAERQYRQMHERVEEVSREVRRIGLDYQIPILATLQANRKAAGHMNAELDEIAFSDAISQDATAAIRVMAEKKANETDPSTILMGIAGSREWHLDGFRIFGEPCNNFTFHSNVSLKDILNANQMEMEEQQVSSSTAKKKKATAAKEAETLKKQRTAQIQRLATSV